MSTCRKSCQAHSEMNMKKNHVMQLINTLEFGGAESLALTISSYLNKSETCRASICGLFGGKGPLADIAEKNAITVRYFDERKKSRLEVMWELYRLLRRQQVNLMQVHGVYLLQYAALPALLAGTKIFYTEHAKYTLSKSSMWRRKSRYLSLFAKRVVCVSNDMKNFLVDNIGIKPSRIEVIHNGVDLSSFNVFHLKSDAERENEGLVIGTVARLSEPKDHGNLLRAFALVLKKIPKVRLMLVGDGDLRADIEFMIRELGIEENVEMLGRRGDIPELLATMDIFVLPSKREGFPISILEAMACGKPVVATDVGGVSEIISNREDGIIVQPEDHESLAAALLQLLEDERFRKGLGSKAFDKALSSFGEEVMMKKYMNLFTSTGGCRASHDS